MTNTTREVPLNRPQNQRRQVMTNTTQAVPENRPPNIGQHYAEANKDARNAESKNSNGRMSNKNKKNANKEQDARDATSTEKVNRNQPKKNAAKKDDVDMDWNAPYTGKRRCAEKKCTLDIETETHEGTLWNRYGPKMKCSGCYIGLLEAMKKTKLAMVCRGCKDEKCRFMLCLECNNNTTRRGRNTSSRGRKP